LTRARSGVLAGALLLFVAWLAGNIGRLTGDQEGLIRFVLGLLFALLILGRCPRERMPPPQRPSRWAAPLAGGGALLALLGIVFNVHQFEWLGLIVMLGAALRWALPWRWARNVPAAMFLLYWVHPLPGQVFGRLQFWMQALSVRGAEWLLHILNVRIWADGLVLHTGLKTFGVPESCSGMRTGVTVLLCTLGVSRLFRFRWHETAALLALGWAQVLALNVARVAGMVLWAPRMPEAWADHFLHDTLGVFLLVSILLAQAEASWWKLRRERQAALRAALQAGTREKPDRATMLPRFWRRFLTWWFRAAAVAALALGLALALYKRRPAHRVEMIRGVIENLLEHDREAAERAIQAALRWRPGDRELLSQRATALVYRGKYEEAIQQLERLPGGLNTGETIMKSWALMALGRPAEAIALVDALPPGDRLLPGVAIVRAEYAAQQRDVETCSRYLPLAAGWHRTLDRVRALFPFLAAHEQWKTIVDCNHDAPHRDLTQALVAIHANLKLNNSTEAARLLKHALRQWPNNPVYLSSLFALAVRRPGGEWEDVFAENLRGSLDQLDRDTLANYLDYCFQLDRPDLGWLAYWRLQAADPREPALDLVAAKYAPGWFTFRRRQIGVGAGSAAERLDLRPFYHLTRNVEPFRSFWNAVPLGEQMGGFAWDRVRIDRFRKCLAELERREELGKLPLRLEMMYPTVLAVLKRYDEAHARLDRVARAYPELADDLQLQHAVLYAQEAKWGAAYEALVPYVTRQQVLGLSASLLLINAAMNLNLGVAAMEVAESAQRAFPDTPEIEAARAAIWDVFGYKEEALFELLRRNAGAGSPALAQLFYDTGRYLEAEKLSRAVGVRVEREGRERKQYHFAPPAELAVAKRLPPPLTDAEMDREAERAEAFAAQAESVFIRDLTRTEQRWFASHGSREASQPEAWAALGRLRIEKASALHRLTILLARQGRDEEAGRAVARALELLPTSAALRRLQVALSGGARPVIEAARQACPGDGELWLADLVTRYRQEGAGNWAAAEVRAATAEARYPVETIVRAGHFLLRQGLLEAATLAARDAYARAQGYLPAYVLAVKCGAHSGDLTWALEAAMSGAAQALQPLPFFKAVVEIKSAQKSQDLELIKTLEFLREQEPQDTQWAERLGRLYFENRDLRRALTVLTPVLGEDIKGVRIQSILTAAEAARQEGRPGQAVEILSAAYALYPKDLAVLNNYVYLLAQDSKTLPRARELLPDLLEIGGESFVVLDTAAVVHWRSGDLTLARQYAEKAQKLLDAKDYTAPEVNLNAARILLDCGDLPAAKAKAEALRRDPRLPALQEASLRRLLDEIRERSAP